MASKGNPRYGQAPPTTMPPRLLTRDEFRAAVLRRDGGRCLLCGGQADDAHHILERRLFPDGGYTHLDRAISD